MRNGSRLLAVLLLVVQCAAVRADDLEFRAADVFGEGFYPGVLCDQCRDANEYPMDFAAAAYNMFFGDDPWARNTHIGWPFRMYNLRRQYVVLWFEDLIFDVPTLLPNLMTIVVRLQNGMVLRFEVLQDGPDLPVGDPAAPDTSACTCVDSGGADDEDPVLLEEEWELPEYEGVVDIVDPDEDGEFPEWEQEL